MRKVLLIGGDLASGKSTYSRFLSQQLNVTVINKDVVKEILIYDKIITDTIGNNT